MSSLFYTRADQPLRLGPKLGTGGEGTVYAVEGAPELVVKLYHESITDERAAKLEWLARNGSARLLKLTAWPVDVVREQPGRRVAGFTMKRIGQAEEVHALHSPKSRLQKFPEASWAFLLYVAANIARAVAAVHEHGLVVGDLNPKNILVTRQATVHLLDCDSFQVRVADTVYRCEAGFPDYTPPELQGVAFRDVDRTAAHDGFGLGVVIFQLLFLGRHPFSGKFTGGEEMPLERAIREGRFAYGSDAGQRAMQPPPGTLALEAVSEPVMKLFRQAFLDAPDDRPQPREWVTALETLAQALKRCDAHDGHQFYEGLAACPWCEIETRARVRLFNFALTGKQQAQGYFRLADVWREIESVASPPSLEPFTQTQLTILPSKAAQSVARKRRVNFYLATAFAMVVGFLLPFVMRLPLAVILLIVVAKIAHYIANAEPFEQRLPPALGGQSTTQPSGTLTQQLEEARQQAETSFKSLARRWQREASPERFLEMKQQLEAQKQAYDNLALTHAQRLAQVETAAQGEQLADFLKDFPVRTAELRGIGSNITATLRGQGIKTAADVTQPRLRNVAGIGKARAKILLDWRSELEQQFIFNAQHPDLVQARQTLQQEIVETRLRLENELSNGAVYLQRFQHEIKQSQEVLFEPVQKAHLKLEQATRDWLTVTKREPAWQLNVFLVASFLIGTLSVAAALKPPPRDMVDIVYPEPHKAVDPPPPPPPKPLTTDLSPDQQASQWYHEGISLLQQAQYGAAMERFQKVISLKAVFEADAYQGLGEAYQRMEKYKEAIQATQQSLQLRESAEAYQTLGQAHLGLKDWASAKAAFQNVAKVNGTLNWERGYWQAHYNLVRTTQVLKEAQTEMATLDMVLAENPNLIEERFQLAALQALTRKQAASRLNLATLKAKHPPAADALRRLLRTP